MGAGPPAKSVLMIQKTSETVTCPSPFASPEPITPTVTVARFEFVLPSHAANVNESEPLKPASGKYVAVAPARPAVPCEGWFTMRSVSALPSGSLAERGIGTDTPFIVEAAPGTATGGWFDVPVSLVGPAWHMEHPIWKPRHVDFVPHGVVRLRNEKSR